MTTPSISHPTCTAILSAADISDEPPFDALSRLGLQMLRDTP